jgi:hypothetical protein
LHQKVTKDFPTGAWQQIGAVAADVVLPKLAEIFRERCEARAILVEACALDLHEAVDGLQQGAVDSGLVADIGQDAVQRIMANAFVRRSA